MHAEKVVAKMEPLTKKMEVSGYLLRCKNTQMGTKTDGSVNPTVK